jgi:hypothetical protein
MYFDIRKNDVLFYLYSVKLIMMIREYMYKTIVAIFICCFLWPASSHALTCGDLDGAYVYSQENTPVYLGFIGSEFASDSINNSFGSYGSAFSTLSVRNTFGAYGSEYSTYSATNSYSSSPPAIYKNGEVIAHLTTNSTSYEGYSLDTIDASCTFYSSSPQPISVPINPLTFNDVLLDVNVLGGGRVVSSGEGIECGVDCDELYTERWLVSLTATADEGQTFVGWEGCYQVFSNTCYVYMYSPKTVTATFTNNSSYSKADILWRKTATGQNWLWTMNGLAISQSKEIDSVDTDWSIAGRGDFNSDGKSDILWRNNQTGLNYIWMMDGTTVSEGKTINTVADLDWQIKAVADFNGDGKADILWHQQQTGQTYVYLMDGFQIIARSSVRSIDDLNWQIAATTDVNGDGKSDVIWRHQRTGLNYIWLMDGYTLEQGYALNTVPNEWELVGAGDLNGDGHGDIVWRNPADGRNWAYLMKDGQIETSQQINTVKGAEWQIKSIADFDGDGKADIFWHNQTTGLTYVYLIDGAAITSRGALNVVSTNWQVIGK